MQRKLPVAVGLACLMIPNGACPISAGSLSGSAATANTALPTIQELMPEGVGFSDVVALSGTTMVAGAPMDRHDSGRAYVFGQVAGRWREVAVLRGSDTVEGDRFGSSVAVYGNTIVVGAEGKAKHSGGAYVFDRMTTGWQQIAELNDPGRNAGDGFGWSVALSGSVLAVGAIGFGPDVGRAYAFSKSRGSWHETAELEVPGTVAYDEFGGSVAVSGDTIVVGSQQHGLSGNAYVFTKTAKGWEQPVDLFEPDPTGMDWFGCSVAVSGPVIAVGADGHRGGGRVYMFTLRSARWALATELKASGSAPDGWFGDSVSLSGETVAVGAENRASGAGRVYVFAATDHGFRQLAELEAGDPTANTNFGQSVSVSRNNIAVGLGDIYDAGWARHEYVFTRSSRGWHQLAMLRASTA